MTDTSVSIKPFSDECDNQDLPEAYSDHEHAEEAQPTIPSFAEGTYKSHEMRRLLQMREPETVMPMAYNTLSDYKSSDCFPDWMLSSSIWKTAPKASETANEISDILKIPLPNRTTEQKSELIHWLMSVWPIANTMGFKRCDSMFKEFKHYSFEPGQDIVKQGERGLEFYIIISGTTNVHKIDIGTVGQLSKGKCFGELALTQAKDERTATVTAQTKVEVLSLHKSDYEFFVRDLHETERRENFQILSNCNLFKSWTKAKIEKICNTCRRKTFAAGDYIFRQGDKPEDLFVVVDGSVNIFKELVIVCRNRWPVGNHKWRHRTLRVTQPIMLKTLQRGDFFGEVAILKNQLRSTSAIAVSKNTVLISLDKQEFLHSVNQAASQSANMQEEEEIELAIQKYIGDEDVLDKLESIKGGPSSAAFVGGVKLQKGDYSSPRPTTSENHRPFGKTGGSGKLPPPTGRGRMTQSPQRIFPEAMSISRDQASTERMRSLAMNSGSLDQQGNPSGYDFQRVFNQKKGGDKRQLKSAGAMPHITVSNRAPPPASRGGADKARRGSITFVMPKRRNSLPGLDNEGEGFIFDPNKVVLRNNSVIRIGMVYEHLYQKLQQETIQTMEGNKADDMKPKLVRRASVMLNDTLQGKYPENLSPHRQRSGSVMFNNSAADLNSPNRRVSMFKSASQGHSFSSDDELDKSPQEEKQGRRGSMMKEPKLLSKSKISYRDAIEG